MRDMEDRAQLARGQSPYLTTKQAAFHLAISANTLLKMRRQGRGPICRMHGRACRYHIDDLAAWSLSNAKARVDD